MAIRRPGPARNADAIARMIRIDHAGEYGAVQIYRGQRAVFGRLPSKTRIARQLEHMEADEQDHLDAFDRYIAERGVRPTLLSPAWRLAGFGLGVATALMGEKAAHACTEAVESVIENHYGEQVQELQAMGETELAADFARYQEEETAHKDLAVEEGAHSAPGYPLLSALIKTGCRIAIKVTERI
ncbi:MAG: demethoxyubiquinone hydroxylase family protein [Caulobacterales bacterium]|uniref:demethoxyubiquinone hydroxylase family protein n=1 Tax=Glycocaulis sp. TaxID=1969725 RepID=UPI003FA07857